MEPKSRKLEHYLTARNRDPYKEWFDGLRDKKGEAAVLTRLDRVERGLFGDHRSVGDGVYELRFHDGSGYRIYYGLDGEELVILLGGGNKRTQDADIEKAKERWRDYRAEENKTSP